MAETPETNKPDFRNGFPIRDLGDGSMISGQADGEELILARRGDEVFAISVPLHPLRWPARRRLNRGRHRALSLAPCLF